MGQVHTDVPCSREHLSLQGVRQEPQELVRESIKYRRRAQEAERRVESLEAELADLRRERDEFARRLEEERDATRSEAQALQGRLEAIERDRHLERGFLKAGCVDVEAAMALARERLADQEWPSDLEAFTRSLLDEKLYLRGETSSGAAAPAASGSGLPPRTPGIKAGSASAHRRFLDRLADQARRTGHPKDVMTYMRARRGAGT